MKHSSSSSKPGRGWLALGVAALLGAAALPASAAVFTVTKTADTADGTCDRDCSLREAIVAGNAAASSTTILLPAGTYTFALAGAGEDNAATGDLDVHGDLTIVGDGALAGSLVDAHHLDRAFDVHGGGRLELAGVGVGNGQVTGDGGAIRVAAGGSLTLSHSQAAASTATGNGGGVYAAGTATITASTISDNTATGNGGGIEVPENGSAALANSTLDGNHASGNGGGLHTAKGLATLDNVTITRNVANGSGGGVSGDTHPFQNGDEATLDHTILALNQATTDADCNGAVNSAGFNLLGEIGGCLLFNETGDQTGTTASPLDPLVGDLLDNGGGTLTVSPATGSPAIDGGDDTCEAEDQRGVVRPVGSACDIGALEVTTACVTSGETLCLNDGRFAVEVDYATLTAGSGAGQGQILSDESGTFWFFDADNREIFIKVLDACQQFDRFWVFVSGLTNVEVTVRVTDTATGEVNTYHNPQGTNFEPRLDVNAFATCSQ